jgi:hypothetical protein
LSALTTAGRASANEELAGHRDGAAGGGITRHRVWLDNPGSYDAEIAAAIHHDFHLHPLAQLPRLARLAQESWPKGLCRFMAPGAKEGNSLQDEIRMRNPRGYRIEELCSHIEEPGTWIALYNVEWDPAYKAFLDEVIEASRPLLAGHHTGIFRVCGYIFISAPPSVTPFHIDRENNIWLQLRGRKTITVWDRSDHEVVAPAAVEKFLLTGSLDGVRLPDACRARGHEFDSGAGDGVCFPCTSAHMTRSSTDWVRPGDGVAVSIGVVFYTRETLRHARVCLCNHELRRRGWTPAPPGRSRLLDAVKEPVGAFFARRRTHWPENSAWSFGPSS